MNLIATSLAAHELSHIGFQFRKQEVGVIVTCNSRQDVSGVDHFTVASATNHLEDLEDVAGKTVAGIVGELLLLDVPISWQAVKRHNKIGALDLDYIQLMLKHKWIEEGQLDHICKDAAQTIRPVLKANIIQRFRNRLSQMQPCEIWEIEYAKQT